MTDFERALYRKYVKSLKDRELFVEREAVYAQSECANPGHLLVLAQEFADRRTSPTVYQNVPKERPLFKQ